MKANNQNVRVKQMKNFFDKKLNTVLSAVLVVLSVLVVVQVFFANGTISAGESTADMVMADVRVNPDYTVQLTTEEVTEAQEPSTQSQTEPTTKKVQKKKKEAATTAPQTTEPTVAFATAIPPKQPADYQAQWNAGYLVAIDNPDTSYACSPVSLADYDRELLERLCMGEFGSGGFIGAALIAQAVKNAICFDGFTSVQSVIDECHYTGRTDLPANEDCKKAVKYIFDENHDAVQHRIMYMYNPLLVQSAFHESQNYILTYEDVRFFDRWGY